jgi:hypothetical protein
MRTQDELRNELDRIREYANCILTECDKWGERYPWAVFRHGYAHEKAQRIIDIIERNRED